MIPLLSLMIGAYIFTRMIELIVKKKELKHDFYRGMIECFAILTILITIFCVVSILISGVNIPKFE